jgi:adenylate kinase family enzyme
MKTVIVGNSGSGKTWLANRLAVDAGCEVVHLDDLFWEPGGFDCKRNPADVERLIATTKSLDQWIVEGVFGELAERYLDDASCIIWLDIAWDTCKARLERRGSESKRHLGREQSEDGLRRLIGWAASYDSRTDLRSHSGHKEMFDNFPGRRIYLSTEASVQAFAHDAQPRAAVGRNEARL